MRKFICILLTLYAAGACYATSSTSPRVINSLVHEVEVGGGFGPPLIHDGKIYTYTLAGHELICFDISTKSIKWRSALGHTIQKILIVYKESRIKVL